MDTQALRVRIEDFIRRHDLIPPGGEVTCLVSGGADSTCLWHALRALGYEVRALHVAHGLRGAESEEDARFCRAAARRGDRGRPAGRPADRGRAPRDPLLVRDATGSARPGTPPPTRSRRSLYRLAASGAPGGIKPKREDGVVRPLLEVWRDETEDYCRAEGLAYRVDTSNPDTKRGLIRERILPLLDELHPAARQNLLRLAEQRPSKLDELLASTDGSRRVDLGAGADRGARVRPRLARANPSRARGPRPLGGVDDRIRARRP